MAQNRTSLPKELFVTHVKGEGILLKFWGLPTGAVEIVKSFEYHFERIAEELESTSGFIRSDQTPVGFKCAVRSKLKQQWCRAVVLSALGLSEVLVQLIDYGTIEPASVADLRKLDDSFFRYPAQAVECILADVIPTTRSQWPTEAIKFCETELLYKQMSCLIVSFHSTIPVVRIAKKGESLPFVQRLINSRLALINDDKSHAQEASNAAPTVARYIMNTLDPSTSHLVKISFIENHHKFYVQLVAAEVELSKLMEDIQQYTSRPENLSLLNSPQISLPCLAELKQNYYRGLITSVTRGRCVVSFVDYGCTEIKEFQELAVIPPRFLKLSAQAICCTLPRDVQMNSDEFFRIVSKLGLLECHILGHTGEAYVVHLKLKGQDIIMPRQFPPQNNQLPVQPVTYKMQKLFVDKTYEMTIGYINDVSEFYCQLVRFKEHLDHISSALNSGMELQPISLQECQPNLPVIVKFSEDNAWYRAQIVKINHEHDIEVFFVDFGNFDNAALRDVRKMDLELLNIPVQAFKCSLYDIDIPTDSSVKDEMFDFFEETTASQVLLVQIKEFSEGAIGPSYVVTLQEKASSTSINEKIESKFNTLPSIAVSDIEQLYITSFTSLDSFFGQFEKLSSAKLEEMQVEINEFYANARNSTFKPKPGGFVSAKYQEDNQYYRARVESCAARTCAVMFIDYGNRESITLEDIHPLNKKFMKVPQFGVECGLHSFPPGTAADEVGSKMLEMSIQAKMVKEDNRKWLISLTENFPQNIPILEILRQTEKMMPRSILGSGLRGFQEETFRTNEVQPYPPGKENNKRNDFQAPQRFNDNRSKSDNFANENEHASHFDKNVNQTKKPKDYIEINIPLKAYRNVYVSHVISPGEFYCQIEEESSKLQALMQDIENTYSQLGGGELNMNDLKVGSPCCAIFQADGAWYRGCIRKVGPSHCHVYFVDYGNVDSVPVSNVKALKDNLADLSPQALKCKLYNASPQSGKWSDVAIQEFSKMALDKSFVAQFVEKDNNNTYAVNLVSLNKLQEDVLNKQFVNLGHGQLQDSNKILVLNSHAASNNLTFKLPDIKLNSTEAVTVTYGLNPQEIFCQLKSCEREFTAMMKSLQQYYNNLSPAEAIVDRPHSDMICVAQFFQDSIWYRGKITKVDRNSITVLYVDYGNSETVDRKKIRCIAQDYTTMPVQGVKCRINGISPGKSWLSNNNISKYFEGDAKCKFLSQKDDYYVIDLICNQNNVAQQLVKDGLAVGEVSLQREATVQKDVPKPQIAQPPFPKRDTLVPGQLLPVAISYNESPFKFWCQSLDESDILEQLMADVQKHIEQGISPISGVDLAAGCYCMAKYSEDESWYRAQIKSCISVDEYEVFFIDYGNTEVTSKTVISELPPELRKIHHLCFECRLFGASPECAAEKVEAFQAVVDEVGHDMTAKVEKTAGDAYIITLLYEVEDVEKNVSEVLFGADIEDFSNAEVIIKYLPPDVPLGLQEGYVTIVNSPHDFFIQLAGCEDNLADLAAELSEKCEAMVEGENIIQNASVGSACAAKYSEDNNWYRAEILSKQDKTADVLFVDYGNTSNVPVEGLKALDEKFLGVPPYAVKCKLNGIIPSAEQWSESAISTFQDLVNDSLLGITFICKDIPAIVNVSKEDKDVGQSLIDLELANVDACTETNEAYADDHLAAPIEDQLHSLPFDQSYPKRKLSSTKLPVKICYIDTCNKFYIMPLELSTELDTVMKTLEILYTQADAESDSNPESSVLDVLEDPRALLPCVAKYSEDEAWYRALITDIEGDNIYVRFVDYGNSEVSAIKNLKPLTPELLKIPPISMECSLYAIQAVEGREAELTTKLEEFYIDEVELEMELYKPDEPYKIRLYRSGCDIAEMFCQDGLAKEVIPPLENAEELDDKVSVNLTDDLKETLMTTDERAESSVQIERRQLLPVEDISINVKHCEVSEDKIVLYSVPVDLEDELASFQEKLQASYSENQTSLSEVKDSCFCVAKYTEDENWYRAKVLNCNEETVKVQFIDYGNSEMVDRSDLKELLPEFVGVPQFSFKFCPLGVVVVKAEEVQAKLDETLYIEPVQLHLCKYSHNQFGGCFTSLVCETENLMEALVNEKLLSLVYTPNTDIEPMFQATIENSVESIFYILPVGFAAKRDDLQSRLAKHCCDIEVLDKQVNPSRLYAAILDGKWFRVSVVETTETGAVVRCVDFVLESTISLSEMVVLPEEFCHEPLLLHPCTIKDCKDASSDFHQTLTKRAEAGEIFHFKVEALASSNCLLTVKLLEGAEDEEQLIQESGDASSKKDDNVSAVQEDIMSNDEKVDLVKEAGELEVDEPLCSENAESDLIPNTTDITNEPLEKAAEEDQCLSELHRNELLNTDEVHEPALPESDNTYRDMDEDKIITENDQYSDVEAEVEDSDNGRAHVCDEYNTQEEVHEASEVEELSYEVGGSTNGVEDDGELEVEKVAGEKESEESLSANEECDLDREEVSEVNLNPDIEIHNSVEDEKDSCELEENKEKFKPQPGQNSKPSDKWEDDASCNESVSSKSTEIQDSDYERLRELSDVESEIKIPVTSDGEEGNKDAESIPELHAECSGGPIVAGKSDDDEYSSNFSQEPESEYLEEISKEANSNCTEVVPSQSGNEQVLECESEAHAYEEDACKTYEDSNQPPEINVENLGQGDSSIASNASLRLETECPVVEENDWDERPECDIKQEHTDDIETQLSPESQRLPDTNLSSIINRAVVPGEDETTESNSAANLQSFSGEDKLTVESSQSNETDIAVGCPKEPKIGSEAGDIGINLSSFENKDAVEENEATESTNAEGLRSSGNEDKTAGAKLLVSPVASQENGDGVNNCEDLQEVGYTADHDVQSVKQLSTLAEQACVLNQLSDLPTIDNQLTDQSVSPRHCLTDTDVIISHFSFSSGSLIFPVTPISLLPRLGQLKGALQHEYSLDQPPVASVAMLELYAVFSGEEWHRGKILHREEDTVAVMLIDTGLCNTVELSDIRELKKDHKTVPPFALWCVLASAYCPPENSEHVKLFLDTMLAESLDMKQDLTVKVVQDEEPYKVNLYIEGADLLSILLEENQLIQRFPNHLVSTGEYSAKVSSSNGLKDGTLDLSVNLVPQLADLEELTASMQLAYEKDGPTLPVVDSGACAVLHNGMWSRCRAVASEEGMSLLLVDSGERIGLTTVYPLIPEHCLQPPYAFPCKLNCDSVDAKDISSVMSVLSKEEFLVRIESHSVDSCLAIMIDEHFLPRLKELVQCATKT